MYAGSRWRAPQASVTFLLCWGCGGGGGNPPSTISVSISANSSSQALAETQPDLELLEPTPFYRLDLTQAEDGSLSLIHIDAPVLLQQPVPALLAEYLVVGYSAAGAAIEAVPLTFQRSALGSTWAEAGGWEEETTALTTGNATVFVPANSGVDHLDITTAGMRVVLPITEDSLPSIDDSISKANGLAHTWGTLREPLSSEQLAFRFANISFLSPGDEGRLPNDLLNGSGLVVRSEAMNEAIAKGLAAVAPTLLNSVQSVGVVKWAANAKKYDGRANGPHLVLDVDIMGDTDRVVRTLVHESAHNFTVLTRAAALASSGAAQAGSAVDIANWPPDIGKIAARLVSKFRLLEGLGTVWQDLHKAGVKAGYAADYQGDGWRSFLSSDALSGGFASNYGSSNYVEDLAEYVQTVQVPSAEEPGACPRFAGVSLVTREVATTFAKVVLLRGVGAIAADAYDACVQGLALGSAPGIHFPGVRDFESGFHAGVVDNEGSPVFDILASTDGNYKMLFQLALDSAQQSPLGLHRLGSIRLYNIMGRGVSGAYVGDDNVNDALASQTGLVLVTEFSKEHAAGAVFGLILQNAFGISQNYLPYGTFAGTP
jgi:hypothetical protein